MPVAWDRDVETAGAKLFPLVRLIEAALLGYRPPEAPIPVSAPSLQASMESSRCRCLCLPAVAMSIAPWMGSTVSFDPLAGMGILLVGCMPAHTRAFVRTSFGHHNMQSRSPLPIPKHKLRSPDKLVPRDPKRSYSRFTCTRPARHLFLDVYCCDCGHEPENYTARFPGRHTRAAMSNIVELECICLPHPACEWRLQPETVGSSKRESPMPPPRAPILPKCRGIWTMEPLPQCSELCRG